MDNREPVSYQYPYQTTNLKLWLTGRWGHGGVLYALFDDSDLPAAVDVPSLLWGILAVLIKRAKERSAIPGSEFLPGEEMLRALRKIYPENSYPEEYAGKYINRLRDILKNLFKRRKRTQIIETHKTLGYRISLDPDCLQFSEIPPLELE